MTHAHPELIEAARKLGPMLREHGLVAERERRLPQEVIRGLVDAKLQSMFTPRSLGGLEVDPATCARVVEEVASFDTSAGWALQSGNTGAWWSARLPKEGAEEIYGRSPNVLMAAAFHPPQQAVEVPGGYRVTGRGPLASNVHDAEWLLLCALVMEGDHPRMTNGMPEAVSVVFPIQEVTVVDTWDSLGMRGSDSNDVTVENVFVPARRSFPLQPEFEPGPHFQGPLYKFPAMAEVGIIITPVLLAAARGAIEELQALAARKTPLGAMKPLREKPTVQAAIARAEATLRASRAYYYSALEDAWQQSLAGKPYTLKDRAGLLLAGVHAAQSAVQVVESMHRLAGTTAIYKRNRLERLLRDAQTLRHHGFIAEARYETAGQVLLDVQPEFGLVAF